MYLVISVLPISITSGTLPPASVASNFCRWVPQLWYWRFTCTPGCFAWNAAVAAAVIGFQLSAVASACSQTVMLCALAFDVAPNAVEAATASAAMSRAAATMRFLIETSNERRWTACCAATPRGGGRRERAYGRQLVYTTLPPRGRLAHLAQGCQDHFAASSSPSARARTVFSLCYTKRDARAACVTTCQVVCFWY